MSFLDKLSANVTNAGKIVSQKAKNMTEANGLSNELRAEKRSIQEALNQIGKLYFDRYKDSPDAEFANIMNAIKNSEKRIAELQNEIDAIRAREPELIPVPEDAPKPAKKPTAMVCMQCGHSYPANVSECQNCGEKLIPQYGNFSNARKNQDDAANKNVKEPWFTNEKNSADSQAAAKTTDAAASADTAAARFCAYCGKPCVPDHAFCAYCGKKL